MRRSNLLLIETEMASQKSARNDAQIKPHGGRDIAKRKYAIGADFGTESGRAVLVDVSDFKA